MQTGYPGNGGAGANESPAGAIGGGAFPNSYGASGGGGGGSAAVTLGPAQISGSGGNTLASGGTGGTEFGGSCGTGGAGTSGSTPSAPSITSTLIQTWYSTGMSSVLAGGGGGGGAGSGYDCSWIGGSAGGSGAFGIYIQANKVAAGTIQAAGENGGTGGSAGGGGGGGGTILLAYGSGGYSAGSYSTDGGAGGSAGANGAAGGNGGSGLVLTFAYGATPPAAVVSSLSSSLGLPSTGNQQGTYAEPVSTGNGNYFYQHTDLAVPGRGMPFVFQRAYNTLDSYAGPLGVNWTHTYNVFLTRTSSAATIKWSDGHTETYTQVGSLFLSPPGVYNALDQNPDSSYVLTQKNQTQYNFTSEGVLSTIVDKNGNTIVLSYNASGELTQITDTVGRVFTITYDASNRIINITDPIGRQVVYTYSTAGDLASAKDAAGDVTTFTYDSSHRFTSVTLPNGAMLLQNTYDGTGRVSSQTNGRNFTTTFAYNTPNPGQTTITDPLGNVTVHTYDALLRITTITDPLVLLH